MNAVILYIVVGVLCIGSGGTSRVSHLCCVVKLATGYNILNTI